MDRNQRFSSKGTSIYIMNPKPKKKKKEKKEKEKKKEDSLQHSKMYYSAYLVREKYKEYLFK
jgi:hypothetical protein